MSSRIYSAVFEEVAITVSIDLFELESPTDAVVVFHSFEISQSSDAGNASDEQLNILVHRATISGTDGTVVTPRPLALGDAAFGGTVETNNTTLSTEGVFMYARSFNIHHGFLYMPPPEARIILSPTVSGGDNRLVITLRTNPADSLTMSGVIVFEEIGG